jgi:hypothetical protein
MTSINPKNVNLNNMRQNEPDIAPNQINNLFQRNNYLTDKRNLRSNEGNNNNLDFNQNLPNNMYKNITSPENMNMNNLNYNTQNNSINLNLGLQNKKNYSTPILNEAQNIQNNIQNREKPEYNNSMDLYERNNKNILNVNQIQNQQNNELYLREIDRLKKEIDDLKKTNEILGSQLKEEQRKNEQLFSIQKAKDENENSILAEISHCLQVSSFEEILPKLNEIINYLNNNVNSNALKNNNQDGNKKIRDELISKLQGLYLSLTGSNEKKEEVTIKILWRWIKHLINTVKQLALEKEKNIAYYENVQESDECKEFCEELISELNLQSLAELKILINNLLNQNQNDNFDQPKIRNAAIEQNTIRQQYQPKGQGKNYPLQEEENEEIEGNGEEGIDEGDENEVENENDNMDPNQEQYENENENEYEDNNEMMEQQMEINEQDNQNDDNYNE